MPGREYLHLDEVEVFGPDDPAKNLALHRPADQISTSQWSQHRFQLDRDSVARLATWMDTYAQRLGSFSEEQERELEELKRSLAYLLEK